MHKNPINFAYVCEREHIYIRARAHPFMVEIVKGNMGFLIF